MDEPRGFDPEALTEAEIEAGLTPDKKREQTASERDGRQVEENAKTRADAAERVAESGRALTQKPKSTGVS